MAVLSRNCERARAWISLDLDDELSELEGAMLRRHVVGCAACASFQADTVALTSHLRLAPLEPMPAPVVLPVRRRPVVRLVQVGTAAAVAVVAAGIGTLLSVSGPHASLSPPVRPPAATELRQAYLDAPQGVPQKPPIAFRKRVGLDPGRTDT